MIYTLKVYVSTNRGSTWVATPQTTTLFVNGGPLQNPWIACDPSNPDVVYVATPSNGVFRNINGTAGGNSTWARVTAVGTASGGKGHNIAYDPNSPVVGGVTQHFMICTFGTGCFETTDGGSNLALTVSTSPASLIQLTCDKFSQFWGVSFGTSLFKYASGVWTRTGATAPVSVAIDPNSASLATNQLVISKVTGELIASKDNGANWISVTNAPTFSAPTPQPVWMGVANQTGGRAPNLNANAIAFDASNPSNLWSAAGLGVWETPNPILGGVIKTSTVYTANTVGIEQLVMNKIISPPGNSPLAAVWDRGFFLVKNPDVFPSVQYPNSTSINQIESGWDIDWASSTPNFLTGIVRSNLDTSYAPASSSDGGNTWTAWPSNPTSPNVGGNIAASTPTNWVVIPGQNATLQYTTNGGTTWAVSSISGGTPNWITNYVNNRMILAADRVTAGVFYAVDTGTGPLGSQNFYRSTDSGATFTKIGTKPFDGAIYEDVLLSVPGQAGNIFYTPGAQPNPTIGHLWKSTNRGNNWSITNSHLTDVLAFGFGAAKPAGSGYPMIYAIGFLSKVFGVYASSDGGMTWAAINVPASQQVWPGNSVDLITGITGDMNVYGRIYVGFRGSGGTYIDTADACPWVNFSNTNPNAALTGTVTLTAQHSGRVPVSSVQFSVDGTNIGSSLTGSGPYPTSWNTADVAQGSHTLKVTATGANCSGSFSIPITTH